MRGDRPAYDDAAERTSQRDLLYLQADMAVVDQHLVARPQDLADRGRRNRQLALFPVRAHDDGDPLPGGELHGRRQVADADLRPLQVADQRDRPVHPLLRLADECGAHPVIVVGAVREVQARRVHSGAHELVEPLRGRAGRPDRRDDLRAPRAHGGHRRNVATTQAVFAKADQPG